MKMIEKEKCRQTTHWWIHSYTLLLIHKQLRQGNSTSICHDYYELFACAKLNIVFNLTNGRKIRQINGNMVSINKNRRENKQRRKLQQQPTHGHIALCRRTCPSSVWHINIGTFDLCCRRMPTAQLTALISYEFVSIFFLYRSGEFFSTRLVTETAIRTHTITALYNNHDDKYLCASSVYSLFTNTHSCKIVLFW